VADPDQRLGGGPDDGLELMNHPWFAGVDWNMILQKQIKPPFRPRLQSNTDVRYIDETFTKQRLGDSPESMVDSNSLKGGLWEGFTYDGKKGFL
jgi:RAC serine/threonine-protein kinase